MDEEYIKISRLIWFYLCAQKEYESYWVRNVWGFGDRMRDYLLEGHRLLRPDREKRP